MWKEHGICDLLWFHRWFASNLKWSSSKQVLRLATLLLTSWQELSFKKLFDFPFSMLQMDVYTPKMWNFGIENQVCWLLCHGHLLKYSCSSGNGFWLIYEDLLICCGRIIFLQNGDMACKRLRGLLEPGVIYWWEFFFD